MLCWAQESLLALQCTAIGEHYGRYRLHQPEAERVMARSLTRYGQLSPVVVCRREERYELRACAAASSCTRNSHVSICC